MLEQTQSEIIKSKILEKTESENKGPVNVYNPQGIMLKKQVDIEHATDGLRKGVYMVGKKKTIVTKST